MFTSIIAITLICEIYLFFKIEIKKDYTFLLLSYTTDISCLTPIIHLNCPSGNLNLVVPHALSHS